MNEIFIYIGSYAMVIFIAFFVMNFLTKGFVFKYIMAKASRGKRPLLRVESITGEYYALGEIKKESLFWKSRAGEKKVMPAIKNTDVKNIMGIIGFHIDEQMNSIVNIDNIGVTPFDAEKMDDLLYKAITAPILNNPKEIIIIILCVVILIIGIIGLFMLYTNGEAIKLLKPTADIIAGNVI